MNSDCSVSDRVGESADPANCLGAECAEVRRLHVRAFTNAAGVGSTAFKATIVPVGVDQVPMIEQTNELVRRFNATVRAPVLTECSAQLSATARLPGIDGKAKMSKSLNNAILLGAQPDQIRAAVTQMYTDERHLRITDPGRVEGNVVFAFLDAFDPDTLTVADLKAHYQRGGLGDRQLKARLDERLQVLLAPIRARREAFARDRGQVLALLKEGTERARAKAAATVVQVRRALGLSYF